MKEFYVLCDDYKSVSFVRLDNDFYLGIDIKRNSIKDHIYFYKQRNREWKQVYHWHYLVLNKYPVIGISVENDI